MKSFDTTGEVPQHAATAPVRASLLEYLHGCPLCFSTQLGHYCRVPSLFNEGEFIRYERCRACGTVLRNPRMPAAARLAKYEDKVLPPEEKDLDPRNQVHCAHMLKVIQRFTTPEAGKRLLDFGCGAGGFLVEARTAGFEVMGLEVNRDLARHVRETHGIAVYRGLVSDPDFAEKRFDVIVSSQVFEHLLDPRQTLLELRTHLRPAGLVLIEVPNLRSFQERLRRGSTMDDSHLFYFSAGSLSWLLRDCGFRVLRVQEGLRLYRHFGSLGPRLPPWLTRGSERLLAMLQLKTGLSILARLD